MTRSFSRNLPALTALVLTFSALASGTHAAEAPTITISKTDALPVVVAEFTGADGAAARKIMENDLTMSGHFTVVGQGGGSFKVSAVSGGGSLQGSVVDSSGKVVLQKSYSGSPRGKVHAFADDIVETITGKRGIANTKIAFVATRTGSKEIYTADYDGANVVQLTKDNTISVGPSLSADGRRLVYTSYKSGYADVYLVDLGNGARDRIIKFPGTNTGAAFSPSGSQLAVTLSKDGNPELYVTGANGSGPRRLTRTRGVESSPCWSPGGDEIVYSSDDTGGPQLYRIGANGGGARAISTGQGYCTEPNWSPDGTKIAFNSRGGGAFQVCVYDLQGGGTRTVGEGQDPVWGADSKHLIFSQGGSLILLDTRSGKRFPVVTGLGKISEPTWSR